MKYKLRKRFLRNKTLRSKLFLGHKWKKRAFHILKLKLQFKNRYQLCFIKIVEREVIIFIVVTTIIRLLRSLLNFSPW